MTREWRKISKDFVSSSSCMRRRQQHFCVYLASLFGGKSNTHVESDPLNQPCPHPSPLATHFLLLHCCYILLNGLRAAAQQVAAAAAAAVACLFFLLFSVLNSAYGIENR